MSSNEHTSFTSILAKTNAEELNRQQLIQQIHPFQQFMQQKPNNDQSLHSLHSLAQNMNMNMIN